MSNTVQLAGVRECQFLCARSGLPPQGQPAVSVAIDDIILFERSQGSNIVPGSVSLVFDKLDAVWREHGIVPKTSKSTDREPCGTALGMELVHGRFLMPKRSRMIDIVSALICLLEECDISPADLGHFLVSSNGYCLPIALCWPVVAQFMVLSRDILQTAAPCPERSNKSWDSLPRCFHFLYLI